MPVLGVGDGHGIGNDTTMGLVDADDLTWTFCHCLYWINVADDDDLVLHRNCRPSLMASFDDALWADERWC